MKHPFNFFNLLLTGILITFVLAAWRPLEMPVNHNVNEESCNTSRSVQASGAAVVYVKPDRALIQLGVQSNGSDPNSVQKANFTQIQKVTEAIRSLGVEVKDIASDYYLVYPLYDDYSALVIKGYRIDNTLSITLRDVNLVDDVIIAALKAGANEVQDVQFYTSELRKFRDQAREMAVKAAGEKANALANAAGAQTSCVLNISENTWTQYYGSWRGGRQTAIWAQNVAQNASPSQNNSAQADDSPVNLGQIAVRAEVNGSYGLK